MKNFAFKKLYVAKSSDIQIGNNDIVCTRLKCKNKKTCGFIPNYPIIVFEKGKNQPKTGWVPIENSLSLFEDFASSKGICLSES